MIDLSLK